MTWGSAIEIERRNRIMASVYAYAYEIMADSLVTDSEYDLLCLSINPSVKTGHLDDFFENEFDPSTGLWIYKHPDPEGIVNLYHRITGKMGNKLHSYKNDTPPVTKSVSNMGFKTRTDIKIYLASLGFRVIRHTLFDNQFGRLDFTFDNDFFHVTQPHTGISKSISYKEYFNR